MCCCYPNSTGAIWFALVYYIGIFTMAYRRSIFDRITRFALNSIKKHPAMTLARFCRMLYSNFGDGFFRKRRNVTILTEVMEFLLYTKRLIVVDPDERLNYRMCAKKTPPPANNNTNDNNNNNNSNNNSNTTAVVFSEYQLIRLLMTQYIIIRVKF